MSLTAELSNPRSPVSRFLSEHLPGADLHTAYQHAVRGLRTTIRPPESLGNTPWTMLGTAIDLRIRTWLGETDHMGVREGIAYLRNAHPGAPPGLPVTDQQRCLLNAAAAGDLLLQRLASCAVASQPLTADQEDAAARAAIVAARYDAIFRTIPINGASRAVGHFTRLPLPDDPDAALLSLTAEIPTRAAEDIRRQFAAAATALAGIKGRPLTCSPTFAGSPHVGHAEGDFIAGKTLIDVKSTITPDLRPAKARKWFHQLAGYLLLDYDDAHEITAVGIYLARQATLLTWPVRDFLRLMGARTPLDVLRARMKNTLAPQPVA
ncbi:hypothetical protein [Streptomyces violaceusniger]|uniref:Uncharacterized protein n=1 Tax=Streptomyces violaceusniger (strain Tu 4113) TaxID=653045 RepID=G2PHZ1_STRV4|nr:hypothetical protein [Streptomyces violaceusniger]AEM88942.1 hypothetical protein Strvi_0169 [Streptomyces violaceusniger Tu 4113]